MLVSVIESASSVSSGWPSHRPTRASRVSSVPVVMSCHWRLWSLSSLLTSTDYRQLSTPRAPSRPVSINESFQLKTVKEMTRDERKRLLERFEIVFLQTDQVQEFQEVFEAGVRHECSSSLYLSWLPLKLYTMETEQEVLDRERGEGRCKYEEKGEKEYPRAKWDVRGHIQTKMHKIISSFLINIL